MRPRPPGPAPEPAPEPPTRPAPARREPAGCSELFAIMRCGSLGARDPDGDPRLLGPADIREIARRLGITPSRRLGPNFLTDAGTLRRITALPAVHPGHT